jgi:proteasome lid subunit RPN8/RPN11
MKKLFAVLLLATTSTFAATPGYIQLLMRPDVKQNLRVIEDATMDDGLEHSLIIRPASSYIGPVGTQDHDTVPIPEDAIAFVHTHPDLLAYQPSPQDIRDEVELAKTHPGFIMYVAGRKRIGYNNEDAMWFISVITPDGKVHDGGYFGRHWATTSKRP